MLCIFIPHFPIPQCVKEHNLHCNGIQWRPWFTQTRVMFWRCKTDYIKHSMLDEIPVPFHTLNIN